MRMSTPTRLRACARRLPILLLPVILAGCNETALRTIGLQLVQESTAPSANSSPLGEQEIAAGLREALHVGSDRVVAQLGRSDGFLGDPQIHIPLPEDLSRARRQLAKIGMASLLDDLEVRLNRAAETATPAAKELFWRAIGAMTLDDARAILSGSEDAATRYFERQMSAELAVAMRPLIERSLDEVGAVRSFNRAVASYRTIPFAPQLKTDLSGYVVERGVRAIFLYLAREEAAIRHDPLKRTSALLRRVFAHP